MQVPDNMKNDEVMRKVSHHFNVIRQHVDGLKTLTEAMTCHNTETEKIRGQVTTSFAKLDMSISIQEIGMFIIRSSEIKVEQGD